MMPALFISTSSPGKSAFTRRKGRDLSGARDIALDHVKLRVFRLHLIEHSAAPASHDDFVSEFEKLDGKREANTCRASGNKDRATCDFHKTPFVRLISVKDHFDYGRSAASASSLGTVAGFTPNQIE